MESRREKHGRRQPSKRDRLIGKILHVIAMASLPSIIILSALLLLPVSWLALPVPALPADTMIYDQSGHLVSVLPGSQNRIPITYSVIPPIMQNALVAIEDNTYWIEPAIDPVGILRAALVARSRGVFSKLSPPNEGLDGPVLGVDGHKGRFRLRDSVDVAGPGQVSTQC